MLEGRSLPREAIQDFLDGSGLSAATSDRLAGLEPLADRIPIERLEEAFSHWSIPALRTRFAGTSFAELERARDNARHLVSLVSEVAHVVVETTGRKDALGFGELVHVDLETTLPLFVPMVLIFREMELPIDPLIALSRRWLLVYVAFRPILNAFPRAYRRFLAPDGVDRLNERPRHVRESFLRHLHAAVQAHPLQAAAVANPPRDTERPVVPKPRALALSTAPAQTRSRTC